MQKKSKRKKLGSYPYVGVIVSITLALFVTGLFGTLVIYSKQFERIVRDNIRVQVYLRNGLTDIQRSEVEKKLQASDFVSSNKTESPLEFISKEAAAKQFIADTGEDFQQLLGENPLHDAYLVSVDPSFHTDAKMEGVKKEIESIPGVYQVVYLQGMLEAVNRNVLNISLVLIGLAVLFLVTVILLINNTIRLALFSQRFLIRSMQLVGATSNFIQRPFLYRSAGYGAIAGLLASGFVYLVTNYAHRKVQDLTILENHQRSLILFAFLVVTGMVFAVISTYFSIRRYLRMSLDELY